jgi:hypothetical protein
VRDGVGVGLSVGDDVGCCDSLTVPLMETLFIRESVDELVRVCVFVNALEIETETDKEGV